MFQREFLILFTLITAIFLAVAAIGWFAVHELHENSRRLVVDTLPGLVNAGLAEERIHDNRHAMRELLSLPLAATRSRLIETIQTNNPDEFWQSYEACIFTGQDRQNFQTMMQANSNYLAGCRQFLNLVTADKLDEASILFYGDLNGRFQSYNDAAKKVFNYNVQQGNLLGGIILNTTRLAPWAIAGLCVLLFMLGLTLGLRTGLSGADMKNRKRK